MQHMRIEYVEKVSHKSIGMSRVTVSIGDADNKIVHAVRLSSRSKPCCPIFSDFYGSFDTEHVQHTLHRLRHVYKQRIVFHAQSKRYFVTVSVIPRLAALVPTCIV